MQVKSALCQHALYLEGKLGCGNQSPAGDGNQRKNQSTEVVTKAAAINRKPSWLKQPHS